MPKNVVIIGAGGHAKVIADIILLSGDNILGFLDDNEEKQNSEVYKSYKVIGKISDAEKYKENDFIIAIGDNHTRETIAKEHQGLNWYTAVHPNATIADTVKIGDGTAIMAGVVINADSEIGNHCIVNTSSSIDHDNIIDDYVHISPGAHLAGKVFVGQYSWICAGATIINNINIRDDVIVGSGATVLKNLSVAGTYVGTPARNVS
ncbi:acetyltransferase [Candidatus Saccharibacteria bacterium]|nr:acetyltransferase [Candidatus Saccharibacteria bacterium]